MIDTKHPYKAPSWDSYQVLKTRCGKDAKEPRSGLARLKPPRRKKVVSTFPLCPKASSYKAVILTLDTCQSCATLLLSLLTATIPTASGFVSLSWPSAGKWVPSPCTSTHPGSGGQQLSHRRCLSCLVTLINNLAMVSSWLPLKTFMSVLPSMGKIPVGPTTRQRDFSMGSQKNQIPSEKKSKSIAQSVWLVSFVLFSTWIKVVSSLKRKGQLKRCLYHTGL